MTGEPPEPGTLEPFWRFFIESALRYRWVWVSGDYAAAAVWIPPGESELTAEDDEHVEPLLRRLIGDRAPDVLALLERFEEAHPRERPHYYLSLLGTHPDHRGYGKGVALLAANLAQSDEAGIPAYLESTNPVNDQRYERLGFVQVGEFAAPHGGPAVACMWRDPR